MIRRLNAVLLAALAVSAVGSIHAQKTDPAVVKLEAARQKEMLDGDLKGAIEDYRKIVTAAGANRALAAQALVRMAECYQKLGDAESRRIYERVIREYSDQQEFVTLAHTRLGVSTPTSTGLTSRRLASVPIGGIGYGTVSPDGRYFPHTNWANGDLYLRDLVSGTDRRVVLNWKAIEI